MEDFHQQNSNLFVRELEEINAKYSSNRQYFIYKSIILRNLYGVDIMVEATEIAKLRLFLKMVAVVEVDKRKDNLGLDPLPDIDFNIKCGNTLVGYATEKELDEALAYGDIFANAEFKDKISTEMNVVATAYSCFRSEQLKTYDDNASIRATKEMLKERLTMLKDLLNQHMHQSATGGSDYAKWLKDTQPFHWLAEFYQIIKANGGFDVIIGNPPYVVYNPKDFKYNVTGYQTLSCSDLYAFVIERSTKIANNNRGIGMIIPISMVSTDGFITLRNCLKTSLSNLWLSNYSMRPGKLFDGVEKHLTIFVGKNDVYKNLYSSKYHRWYSEERENLFDTLQYVNLPNEALYKTVYPKIGTKVALNTWLKLTHDVPMNISFCKDSKHIMYHTRKLRYFVQFLDRAPIIYNEDGSIRETSELKKIFFDSEEKKNAAIAVYLSTLFFWFYISMSDCRNLNKREVESFTFSLSNQNEQEVYQLQSLGLEIINNLQNNSTFVEANYKKYGKLSMQTFQPRLSKVVADEIDRVLAKHYGFTEEELDFIINYDIKYRMGDELESTDE